MGPYAQWVAGAVDALETYAPGSAEWLMDHEPVTAEHERNGEPATAAHLFEHDEEAAADVMDSGQWRVPADDRLRLVGYAPYSGPYERAAQPLNMDRNHDFDGGRNAPRIAAEVPFREHYDEGAA